MKCLSFIESKPEKGYVEVIKLNQRELAKVGNRGVCGLLSYFMEYSLDKKTLQENDMLDFGSFYEKKERDYGLI